MRRGAQVSLKVSRCSRLGGLLGLIVILLVFPSGQSVAGMVANYLPYRPMLGVLVVLAVGCCLGGAYRDRLRRDETDPGSGLSRPRLIGSWWAVLTAVVVAGFGLTGITGSMIPVVMAGVVVMVVFVVGAMWLLAVRRSK